MPRTDAGLQNLVQPPSEIEGIMWKRLPDGTTYGSPIVNGRDVPDSQLPDLIAVVDRNGKRGYASTAEVFGVGTLDPSSPEEAIRLQRLSVDRDVPVYAPDGSVIDQFTIQGANDGPGWEIRAPE